MTMEPAAYEILMAEDNPADVILVREALKKVDLNCRLMVIEDGAQVIRFLENLDANPRDRRLDLVLLDMHLPKRGGVEILESLRATERYAQTPVIVLSGSSSEHNKTLAEKNAALHYFVKPASLDGFMQLGPVVRSVLGAAKRARDPNLAEV